MKSVKCQSPVLSVIVPIYNSAATLERCLQFLTNQSFESIEIICVDDCSTDTSKEIILEFQKKYINKIIYTKTETRLGPGGARNVGISLANGQFISFVDGDDWPDSYLYSTVLVKALEHDADIAIFGVIDEFEIPLSSKIRYEYKHFSCIDHTFALRLLSRAYNNSFFISSMVCQKIFKRSFLQKNEITFHSSSYFEDDLFSFCCFLCESKIIAVPGSYYHYYQRPNSITHTFSKKHIDDLVQLTVDLKKQIISKGLWEKNQKDYYAFCSKCIRSALNALFTAEPSVQTQKRYISYLATKLQQNISINEWIDYMDIQSIKRLFMF